MTKSALVVIADGTEEIEAVVAIDVLRRTGVLVTVAGISSKAPAKCSRDVILVPDISFTDAKWPYDAIVLPGGLAGAKAFCESDELGVALQAQDAAGRIVAAICAAPSALKVHNIGLNKRLTSYPTIKETMLDGNNYVYIDNEKVVVDGNIITSRGPGTSIPFALTIAEALMGAEKAKDVAKSMLVDF